MTEQETHKTADIFNALKGKHTIIVVEHDMGFVKEIGDVISVMHQGKVLAEGTVTEIETNPAVRQAYLGSVGISRCLRSTDSTPTTAIAAPCTGVDLDVPRGRVHQPCSAATAWARRRC